MTDPTRAQIADWRAAVGNPVQPADRVQSALGIESMMVANTRQIRQIAANACRWNMPYQLDFRINTMLDQQGLHTLLFDEMSTSEGTSMEANGLGREELGTALFLRCLVFYKMVGLTPSQPFSGFLTLRFRDYIWLQMPEGNPSPTMRQARYLLERDEHTPEEADPAAWTLINPANRPGTNAAYSFKPGNEPSAKWRTRDALHASNAAEAFREQTNGEPNLLREAAMRAPFDDPRPRFQTGPLDNLGEGGRI